MSPEITVLHVDDDPDVAALVAEMLERERDSFEVLTEHGGGDALGRLGDADVDCVVSDYDMAGMDGLDLLDAVREEHADLPFVLYTAQGSEEIASEAISAGVTDYVQKRGGSEQYEVLAKRVENAVERVRARRQAASRAERNRVMRDELAERAHELSRYERLVETMNDGAYMLDDEGVVTATNEVLTLLTGYTREEIVGSHVSAFLTEDAVERGRERVRSLLSEYGPEVEVFEAELEHASGDRFPAEVTVSLLPFDDEFRGTIGVVRDVSEREHAKARLREERRKIKQLHEVATAMEDCESRGEVFELVVETAETVLDFDACVVGVADDGLLRPEAVSEDIRPQVVDDPIPVGEGIAGRVYDGEQSRVVADATPDDSRDIDDAYRSVLTVPFGDVGVFQALSSETDAFDDRDRELAELLVSHAARTAESLAARAALATSEEKYRTVVEESRDPMAIVRDGEFVFVNRTTADTLGWSREDLLGTRVLDVVHPEDRDDVAAVFGDGASTGTVEARVETADGFRHYEVSAREITYEGEPAVLASARDITERVEAKRELERQNERLEAFASVVSHDLRNPLTVALTSLDGVRESVDGEALDRVESSLRRMERLIDDLLTLAREGEVVEDAERVRVGAVAQRAWGTVATADATLRVASDGTVAGDESRLVELFENLFRNAVEHAGSDVRVAVGVADDGFYVADDGEGVPEDGDVVFEHGYTTAEDGTGFGLSIVEEVASAHGWEVSVAESESGGARFEVSGVETGV